MSSFTSELRVRLARLETGLSPPVKYFTYHSKAVLKCGSFVLCMSCVLFAFAPAHCCLVVHEGYECLVFVMFSRLFIAALWYMKGKGWPLGFCLWCLLWFCYFPIWYPRTGVVLDCIDSWSLLSFLLSLSRILIWKHIPCTNNHFHSDGFSHTY